MKSLTIFSSMICLLVMNITHPILLILLISSQSFIMCLIIQALTQSSWFSYILFLVFIGGLMVLFIYISSLAPNEKFHSDLKFTLLPISSGAFLMVTYFITLMNTQTIQVINLNVTNLIFKIYSPEMFWMTATTMIYLLLTLIVAVNLTMMKEGSLRPMKT